MKCAECPDYADCHKKYNLTIKRRHCPKAKGIKVLTNADRIRAMSDEEMAEFLESTHTNMAIKLCGEYIVRAKEYIEIWLKQPAEVVK